MKRVISILALAATVGLASPDPLVSPSEALQLFGKDLRSARKAYVRYVNEPDHRVRRGLTWVRPGSDPAA